MSKITINYDRRLDDETHYDVEVNERKYTNVSEASAHRLHRWIWNQPDTWGGGNYYGGNYVVELPEKK